MSYDPERVRRVVRRFWHHPRLTVGAIAKLAKVNPCTVSATAKRLGLPPRWVALPPPHWRQP